MTRPLSSLLVSESALEIGARLSRAPASVLVETAFAAELEGQRALLSDIGLADLAHTVMLIEVGVVPPEAGGELLAALLALQADVALPLDPALGDVYTNREAWLTARTPTAGWLGAGRARREATTIAWHLAVRWRLLGLAEALGAFANAVARRAQAMRTLLAPDYTYLQAGQPSTFGHYLLSFAFPALRDLDRLQAVHSRVDRSPAGCGSANGSTLPHDRARLADLLGFSGIVAHARDAMWQADAPIECMSVVVAAAVNLDRLAEDLLFFCSTDVALVQLSDTHARASKILPQKRNPYALAHVRAVANRLIGVQASLAASGRTPSGQIDSRLLAYGEVLRALDDVTAAAWLMASVVDGLVVDSARASAKLRDGFTASTDLSELLLQRGAADYRTAQRLVGQLVRTLADEGRTLSSLTPGDVARACEHAGGAVLVPTAGDIDRALDAMTAVESRHGVGGAAPAAVMTMVHDCVASLGAHEVWRMEALVRQEAARDALIARAHELSTSTGAAASGAREHGLRAGRTDGGPA